MPPRFLILDSSQKEKATLLGVQGTEMRRGSNEVSILTLAGSCARLGSRSFEIQCYHATEEHPSIWNSFASDLESRGWTLRSRL